MNEQKSSSPRLNKQTSNYAELSHVGARINQAGRGFLNQFKKRARSEAKSLNAT